MEIGRGSVGWLRTYIVRKICDIGVINGPRSILGSSKIGQADGHKKVKSVDQWLEKVLARACILNPSPKVE